jgi:hypothetical protein
MLAIAATCTAMACAQSDPAPSVAHVTTASSVGTVADPALRSLVVASGAQVTIGDVKIGAGNIWETDTGGGPERTAQLWIREPSKERRHPRVHAGQTLEVAGSRISILEIAPDSLRLGVSPIPEY